MRGIEFRGLGRLSRATGAVRIVAVITSLALLAALGPWPYGYYQMLRVVVFFAGLYCTFVSCHANADDHKLAWAAFAVSLIFNPFLPVHLPREIWAVLNLSSAGLFGFIAYRQPK